MLPAIPDMQQYEIILKNEKEKTYRFISWLLISANFITLFLYAFISENNKIIYFILAFSALLSIPVLNYFKFQKLKTRFSIAFIIFAVAWFLTPYWWIGPVNIVFLVLDKAASGKLKVEFHNDKIRFPSLINRDYPWRDLSNAILKDGILTIDFKTNKLIQQQIAEESSSVNEKEFNEFCRQHLIADAERK